MKLRVTPVKKTGDKCNKCMYSFCNASNLRRHNKMHIQLLLRFIFAEIKGYTCKEKEWINVTTLRFLIVRFGSGLPFWEN